MKKERSIDKEFSELVDRLRADGRLLDRMERLSEKLRERFESLPDSDDRSQALESVDAVQQILTLIRPNH